MSGPPKAGAVRPAVLTTPKALAAESRRRLAAAADPKLAERLHAYFKKGDRVAFYGLKTATLRAIERELWERIARRWTLADAVDYCELMLSETQLEAKGLGLLLLARQRRAFEPRLLATAKRWLVEGRSANWATTDSLASLVVAEVLRRFPDRIPIVTGWTRSRSLWVRRTAAVALVPLARRGEALAAAYRVAAALLADGEDLIHKASGWLLREAGKTDPARLERFLLEHGAGVPRTTLRYAIERFAPARRRKLLADTRA